ncbi:MAG: fumarate/nitrate reduction transcriptional regulator Fnr [Gammaproteobacteria bacterium]|nr:fumarate/nitrate reduction transcriptional regulator Fnr [Gammaproteobacteria bacterium]
MSKVINIKSIKVSCSQCSLSQLCLPRNLDHEDFEALSSIVKRERPLLKGEPLFELGQPFKSLFAIRTGSVKVFLPTNEGDEQIVGFHMPGELLGFDGMGHDSHSCSAVALESTSICELPYNRLQDIARELPSLTEHFMTLMSNEIADEHAMMLMLAKKSAEARMATFLLSLSARFSKRGFSARQFNLTMSRHDIANYLGLAVETVSRIMTHMQDAGIINVDRRFVSIENMDGLRGLAGFTSTSPVCAEHHE